MLVSWIFAPKGENQTYVQFHSIPEEESLWKGWAGETKKRREACTLERLQMVAIVTGWEELWELGLGERSYPRWSAIPSATSFHKLTDSSHHIFCAMAPSHCAKTIEPEARVLGMRQDGTSANDFFKKSRLWTRIMVTRRVNKLHMGGVLRSHIVDT